MCWIWVAPFVKQYLITNFKVDDPEWPELVNISQDRSLDVLFRSRLVKPSNRYDKRISQNGNYKYRNCKVALEITKSDFIVMGGLYLRPMKQLWRMRWRFVAVQSC